MSIWVLTREINNYDQYGEYFEGAWEVKPTHQMLTKLDVPCARLRHVLNGGGRPPADKHGNLDDVWWFLRELPEQEVEIDD